MNKFTHVGWLSFCPVLIGDTHTGNPVVRARKPWLQPLLHLAVGVQSLAIGVCSLMNPNWEPVWNIRITGKLV